jgi:internalin A
MVRDQEMVKQLQRRLRDWDPEGRCKRGHSAKQCCEYGEQGRLITLHLCELELAQVPSEVWQFLALQRLYLSNNQLSTLPAEVGNLTALQRLDLGNNRLSTLPAEVGNLTALQRLELRNNLLQTPPEIIAQGIPALLAYLRTLQQANVERFEAKVILVGEGGMGKTSLLRALEQRPFVEGLPATHGIEIVSLYAPHPTRFQQKITLYTWDFGGQEIYQATHQFFLTQRSVYLLIWNARLGGEACRLPFWLDTIRGHAPDARILLVATHSDLWQTPTINLASYQQRYPQIVGLCAMSNKTGDGLEDLKRKIVEVVAQTPFVGQKWPRTWVEAEQALLARPEHHIDTATFITTCVQQKIEDEMERETFGRYLHDLGKILYFHDDPVLRMLIVLKPNWISKAISRVLVDPHVQQAGGVLEHRELARIWATDEQGQSYPRSLYPIFVRMMERFELCYQLEPERPGQPISQSLIPQLLPDQPPASLPPIPTVPKAGQVLVEMRYTLSFVPAGLMSWFLVRTHRYSQRLHWREGARLAYAGQQAHIELDIQQREISINAWGPFPYTFLLILKQTLDDLLQTFQGLHVQHKIPCRCSMQLQIPHYHVYEALERQLARGQNEIVCTEGMRLSILTLLYGIHASTIPQMVATVQHTQQLIAQNMMPDQKAQQNQMSADELRHMFARLDQGQEFLYRTMLHQDQKKMKLERQKLSNTCPGLFVLERVSSTLLRPHDWVGRGYRLRLLCQYPHGPHPIKGEQGYEVRQGKEWWNTMSPWLRRIVKMLEVGMPLGKAVNEVFKQVDIERFAPEIDVFNEILSDLPEIDAIDDLSNAQLDAKMLTMQRLEGSALEALHTFLKGHPRPWQGLSQVITDDDTMLWLCEHHRNEFEAHLIAGIDTL